MQLQKRSVWYFLATMPPFHGVPSLEASEEEQRQAYAFIRGIYEALYQDSSGRKMRLLSQTSIYRRNRHRQRIYPGTRLQNLQEAIQDFVYEIHKICMNGTFAEGRFAVSGKDMGFGQRLQKQCTAFGVEIRKEDGDTLSFRFPGQAGNGLRVLAAASLQTALNPALLFSRGIFDPSYPYAYEIFRSLSGNQTVFEKLLQFLNANGYHRREYKEFYDCISLDYIKRYRVGLAVQSSPESTDEMGLASMEFCFQDTSRTQWYLGLRIPHFQELLRQIHRADTPTRKLVLAAAKSCNQCCTCIRTHPGAAGVKMDQHVSCPQSRQLTFSWEHLDETLAGDLIGLLQFMERLFGSRTTLQNACV